MKELFSSLGLTENESTVYEMLLHEGPSLAGKITQKTGIHRRNVYDCLERLIKKGLVGYIKENNRAIYAITDPITLQEQLAQQQRKLAEALPEMQAYYHKVQEKKETLFFRGVAGIKQVLRDQLAQGEEVLVLATTVNVDKVVKYYFPHYQDARKARSIPTRMLFCENYRNHKKQLRALPLCTVRFMEDGNTSPLAQYIYADCVALIVYSDDPFAILIRQKEIARGFRDNFEALWKTSKP